MGSAIFGEGDGLRGSGPDPSPGYPLPVDSHTHALALAQLEAVAVAAERLDRAYASIERRVDRLAALMPAPDTIAISPGQLRLVVGA